MTTKVYLRPIGRLTRPPGIVNAAPDKLVRIGGQDDAVFSACELIERRDGGWTDRRIIGVDEARHISGQAGSIGDRIKAALQNLTRPRSAPYEGP